MKIKVMFAGAVRGRPVRHSEERWLSVLLETDVEISEFSYDDVPVACRRKTPLVSGKSCVLEHRFLNGSFYVKAAPQVNSKSFFNNFIENVKRNGVLTPQFLSRMIYASNFAPLDLRMPNPTGEKLRHLRNNGAAAPLVEWNLRSVNPEDVDACCDAVREHMRNYILVNGDLHVKAAEPTYQVSVMRNTSQALISTILVGSTRRFQMHVDMKVFRDGLEIMDDSDYYGVRTRAFSLTETDSIKDFSEHLREMGIAKHYGLTSGEQFFDIDSRFFSTDFDDLEFIRFARDVAYCPENISVAAKNHRLHRAESLVRNETLDHMATELKGATREYQHESEDGDPSKLALLAEELRLACAAEIDAHGREQNHRMRKTSVFLDHLVPLPYFGNVLDRPIGLDLRMGGLSALKRQN